MPLKRVRRRFALLTLLMIIDLITAQFSEELLVQPLADGNTLFPEKWGHPQLPVHPPGATLQSRFLPRLQDMQELLYAWGNLTHILSGMFCSSLNFLADPAMVAMPSYAFGPHNSSQASQWFFGSLPREAVCTENLTPWLKLLPCQGRQGLTQLMDRPTLYGASYHAMRVHLQVPAQQTDSICTVAPSGNEICPAQPQQGFSKSNQGHDSTPWSQHLSSRPATLTQTLTLVLRPEQMHTSDEALSPFDNFGKVMHPDLDLQRLFNKLGAGACPKATHTHIYFHMPKPTLAEANTSSTFSDLQGIDNAMYSVTPAPDTVISSSSGVFLLFNLTADQASQQSAAAEKCLQPKLTWRQQPELWQAEDPPVKVQQFVAGRYGDRGSLILQLNIHERSRSRMLGADVQQNGDHRTGLNSTQNLRFCILQMVPWYFRLLHHTMQLTVDDKVIHLDDVLMAHHLEPAEGPGTTALLELCLKLPAATNAASLTIDFQKAFLTVFDHPPDAHRGFDIPAALFTFLDARPDHQGPWMITQQANTVKNASFEDHNIMQHFSRFKGHQIYTTGVLVPLPTPDFSMPYNVCCLSCTVLAIYVLGIVSLVFGKPGEAKTKTKAAKLKQILLLLVMISAFGGIAVSLDKSLQRQVQEFLVNAGIATAQT